MKASEIIDCICTIVSISNITRFAYANVWSVFVNTRSLLVAFAKECFAFISICRKIRKKQRKKYINKISNKDISILVSIKEP